MTTPLALTLIRTAELRAGSIITEREIAALKKRWSATRGANARLRDVDAEQCAFQDALPMRVSDEQAKKGLDWLRKLLITRKGTLRRTALIQYQGIDDCHLHVVHALDHFLFVGFHEDHNNYGNVCALYPVYRAVASNGQWFEYIARPWTGGEPTFGQLHEDMS